MPAPCCRQVRNSKVSFVVVDLVRGMRFPQRLTLGRGANLIHRIHCRSFWISRKEKAHGPEYIFPRYGTRRRSHTWFGHKSLVGSTSLGLGAREGPLPIRTVSRTRINIAVIFSCPATCGSNAPGMGRHVYIHEKEQISTTPTITKTPTRTILPT